MNPVVMAQIRRSWSATDLRMESRWEAEIERRGGRGKGWGGRLEPARSVEAEGGV